MLVELIVLDIAQKIVLSLIPIWNLNMTSRMIPHISKTQPITIEIFRYLVGSNSLLTSWGNIINTPKRPKNIMSFPLDDPIKKRYVIGLIIGLNMSVMNIIPANNMNINPIMKVLLSFINNNLSINSLNK